MSNNIQKKIIYIFIILQPILDLITSIMVRTTNLPITIGILVRSIFMAYIFLYSVFLYKPQEKIYKYLRLILVSIGIYILVFFMHTIATKPSSYMLTEIKGVIKLFYFPIVLIGLIIYNSKEKIIISNKMLMYLLLAYTGTIFIATITGTSFRSYNEYLYGEGTVGWFFAANEIGTIIAILIPFTVVNVIQNKLNVINIISIILCIWSSLYVGTKVPFIGFIGVLFGLFIYTIVLIVVGKYKDNVILVSYKKIIISILIMTFGFSLLFIKSPIYKNIMFNYGHIIQKINDVIKIDRKEEIVTDHSKAGNELVEEEIVPIDINTELEEQIEQEIEIEEEPELEINMHIDQDNVINALLSNRTEFANEVKGIFKKSSIPDKLIGLGHVIQIKDGVYTDKTIEMDPLDIFYRHGIIGSILYFSPLILIIFIILTNIIKNLMVLLNIDVIASILSIGLGISIAFVSGHILTAPGVSIYIVLSILVLYNNSICNYENKN